MKKIYMFVALLFISGVVLSQVQRAEVGTLSSVKVVKEINTMSVSNTKGVIDSLHYDGDNSTSIGTGAAANFGVYAFFPAATLASHATANHYILSVKVYINVASNVSASQIRFYSDTLATAMVYSQSFTPVDGWNNVFLSTPFAVPSTGNLYIGYDITATAGHPAGCDAGPANPNGNWINMGSWAHLVDLSPTLIGNWNIRAMCGTLPTAPSAICSSNVWDAGDVLISNSSTSSTFVLTNTGIGTLTCSAITGLSVPFSTSLVPATVSLTTGMTKTFTFTYTPSAVTTTNQTVVIATNGGNITINLTGAGYTCGTAINTFPMTESFENAVFPSSCWTKASPDAGTGWAQIASGTTPIPGFTGGTMTVPTGGGLKAAYCTYTTGGPTSNNQWLITPKIAVQTNQLLSFSLFWFGNYQDKLDVKISTTTNAVASFTATLLAADTNQFTQGAWKQFNLPLTAYAGQNIYIAFNEHIADNAVDGAFIAIDLVKVDVNTGIAENKENSTSVYPNPVKNELNISSIATLKNIKIINAIGQVILNENVTGNHYRVNTSSYKNGIYFVQIDSEKGKTTKKFVVNE